MQKIPGNFCKNRIRRIFALPNAKVAQLVEHDLAKVGVAGSNPVFRSTKNAGLQAGFFYALLREVRSEQLD